MLDSSKRGADMQLFETTHSFIVRIWLEETAEVPGRSRWRGQITHVPGGEQRYLKELDESIVFMQPYLAAIGVKFGLRWRVSRWLGRRKLPLVKRSEPEKREKEKPCQKLLH